ncbi:glycosyltransferase family 4 protein [Nitrogeniibacter mangrovi]|uniref:Glycosyltransferase family 4 protein n=1 Tax=Nitrogeniibacter mangrovi TaxID=2016596 RepID=A0A6C1AZ79_9RHOO|nr:glycosyltransferase [Nitrogeniibacter mangrovi]QID16662.1 glycosyltransferase family 4 protein [Nitrogeniibacter mangrovi]
MKVLHVESGRHLYGGGKQVLYLMEGLARRGVDNLLACPDGAHIAEPARAFGTVIELPMKGDVDIGLAGRLKRVIRQHRPDLVHIHSRRGADVWGGVAARLAGVPALISRRVDNPESRWAVTLKYGLYAHVITISEGIRQVLLAEGLAPERVSCVRSALDPAPYLREYDKAAFRATLDLPADTPVAGMVAQLIPRKGHRHLLAALPRVLERHPRLQVLVFGRGPLEAELRQAIADANLGDHVRLMGFVDDLPAQLGCLDLLVHPADMEGLGVSLLQASAAQVPIIACRAGGMPEAVRDGINGLLIDVGDVAALGTAMIRLLDDADLRRHMGAAGRALVLDEFSVDVMCEGNLAIYDKVLARAFHRTGP